MLINLNKTAQQNLIDLINVENQLALTTDEITLGLPLEFADGEGINTRNTQIEIDTVPGGGYVNSLMIRYHRLDIDLLAGVRTFEYLMDETSTLASFTEAMATDCGLITDQVEILDDEGVLMTELPALIEGESMICRLQAVANSLTYLNGTSVTLSA